MSAGGQGWRSYRVIGRRRESDRVMSLRLAGAEDAPLAPFSPGQFLTFRVPDGAGRHVPRNYSISSDPADLGSYRISVRREPGGLGSGHMHEAMEIGAEIEATGPKGQFTLVADSDRPVLLLAGGIGVTPLLAMAHALAAGARCATHLIHAWGGEGPRPFAEELAALAVRAANLRVAACLSGDGSAKEGEGAARFTGRIDADLLRAVLPIGDYEVYLCGPPAFMQAMYDLLTGLGVREERISYEFFGPAKRLARGVAGRAPAAAEAPAPAAMEPPASAAEPVVSFARLGRSAAWDPSCRTLLDFAERQGLEPPFSCRNGICNTCLCVVEGKVRYVEEPLEEPPEGQVHLCCTAPDGPVSLSL